MAYISLYSIPEMDVNYEHVPWFSSLKEQESWFWKRMKGSAEGKIHLDPTRTSVTIPLTYSALDSLNIDYCMIEDEINRKKMYYFVTNFEYKASGATTMTLQLDVIQTYMTDLIFQDSFVDRCHVNRWKRNANNDLVPTENYQDEGLQYGDLVTVDQEKFKYRDKYLIASTSPLGVASGGSGTGSVVPGLTPEVPPSSGGGDSAHPSLPPIQSEDDKWKNGEMSSKGFRFIKGYEAYAAYQYTDGTGHVTIGYGVTQKYWNSYFSRLKAKEPCSEEYASQVSYELIQTHFAKKVLKRCQEVGIYKQCQFDAMVSFVFNLGLDNFRPGRTIYDTMKQYGLEDEQRLRNAFILYRNPGSSVEAGLKARRNQECDMFFGRYSARRIPVWTSRNTHAGTYVESNGGNGWLPNLGGGSSSSGGYNPANGKKTFNGYGRTFVYPLQGGRSTVTSLPGMRRHPVSGQMKKHHGIDIGCSLNEPVYAAHDGKAIIANGTNDPNGYGNWIVLEDSNGKIQTYYAHLNKIMIKEGSYVKAGEQIGAAGTTGSSTGVHLHYELRRHPYGKPEAYDDPIPGLKVGSKI